VLIRFETSGMTLDPSLLAKLIDHSVLRPDSDRAALEAGCRVAREYQVASVCILPHFVAEAGELLAGSGVAVGTTVGFPHGACVTAAKVTEAERALADGAIELDMVVNVSRVLSGDAAYVRADLAAVLAVARAGGARLKVIFETCYLDERHKIALCELCSELRVDWVKTSTGFGSQGATLADVRLMRRRCRAEVGVKASGGIRELDQVLELEPFVTRIGTSQTREILEECRLRAGVS
jgi:deoxyribose-phosphate aldolase